MTTIGVFISLIGVGISLYAVNKSFVLQKQALSEDLAARLRDRAEKIVKQTREDLPDAVLQRYRGALNFFEEVGRLVEKESLDANTAWVLFCTDVARVHDKTHAAIKAYQVSQDNDITIWREFLRLHKRLQEIDAREREKKAQELAP